MNVEETVDEERDVPLIESAEKVTAPQEKLLHRWKFKAAEGHPGGVKTKEKREPKADFRTACCSGTLVWRELVQKSFLLTLRNVLINVLPTLLKFGNVRLLYATCHLSLTKLIEPIKVPFAVSLTTIHKRQAPNGIDSALAPREDDGAKGGVSIEAKPITLVLPDVKSKGICFTKKSFGKLYTDAYAGSWKFKNKPPHSSAQRSIVEFILEPLYKLFAPRFAQVVGDVDTTLADTLTELLRCWRRLSGTLHAGQLVRVVGQNVSLVEEENSLRPWIPVRCKLGSCGSTSHRMLLANWASDAVILRHITNPSKLAVAESLEIFKAGNKRFSNKDSGREVVDLRGALQGRVEPRPSREFSSREPTSVSSKPRPSPSEDVCIFRLLKFNTQSITKIAIKTRCDLRKIYSENDIKMAELMVAFCVSVVETKSCFAETPNKKYKITMIAEPLEKGLAEDIKNESVCIETNILVNDTLPFEVEKRLPVRHARWTTLRGTYPERQKYKIHDVVIAQEPPAGSPTQPSSWPHPVSWNRTSSSKRKPPPIGFLHVNRPRPATWPRHPGRTLPRFHLYITTSSKHSTPPSIRSACSASKPTCERTLNAKPSDFHHWQIVPGDSPYKSIVIRPLASVTLLSSSTRSQFRRIPPNMILGSKSAHVQ
ncbi:conserved hypothetical protein [Culex quinquefasciatus]|uniref:Uncharacterized protein n=1 Tax=Culex quinquefasciatus TaxID=7176 RepID=B0XFU2_CULQU|nr:conserved hypothetical protein [Culex quinquefasciatus]|eukprot:XP_001868514.1 conserved hypothetical protein [Culex quinquefasciatus]